MLLYSLIVVQFNECDDAGSTPLIEGMRAYVFAIIECFKMLGAVNGVGVAYKAIAPMAANVIVVKPYNIKRRCPIAFVK